MWPPSVLFVVGVHQDGLGARVGHGGSASSRPRYEVVKSEPSGQGRKCSRSTARTASGSGLTLRLQRHSRCRRAEAARQSRRQPQPGRNASEVETAPGTRGAADRAAPRRIPCSRFVPCRFSGLSQGYPSGHERADCPGGVVHDAARICAAAPSSPTTPLT